MDDVTTHQILVSMKHVTDLGESSAYSVALRLLQNPFPGHRARGVTGSEEGYLMAGVGKAAGQQIYDQLYTSV